MARKRIRRRRSGGLTKWFGEKWVDISRPKKGGGYKSCGRPKAKTSSRKDTLKCVPAAKAARMTKSQRRSAIRRKEQLGKELGVNLPTCVLSLKSEEGLGEEDNGS